MDRANVTKWIFASIAKHFNSLPHLHISGEIRKTSDWDNWYELKIDGPYLHNLSKDYWDIKIEVDLQIYSIQQRDYLYSNQELQGKGLELFTDSISVFKLGNKPEDDKSYLFCLTLNNSDKHSLDVANFGFVEGNDKLTVSDIEGHYHTKLKNF